MKRTYEDEANRLSKAIDIAVDALKKIPPPDFDAVHLKHLIKTYLSWKDELFTVEPQYKNLKSLQYEIDAVLTYFQESSGLTVDCFWQQIKSEELGYKRENKLGKILKRKKIKNDVEYNFIKDVLGPYQQENMITLDEVDIINNLLTSYEQTHRSP